MKIKQSFIDRCGEISIKEVMAISTILGIHTETTLEVLLNPSEYEHTNRVLITAANVLKINLSDIYEVEPLPHSL